MAGLSSWSDSVLVMRRRKRHLRSVKSLPALLDADREEDDRSGNPQRLGPSRGIPHSWARLRIPKSISEYMEICRFERSHTDGLILVHGRPPEDSTMYAARKELVLMQHATSEPPRAPKLWGWMKSSADEDSEDEGKGPPRVKVSMLRPGVRLEGQIKRVAGIGFFIDVGATKLGLLLRRHLKGLPSRVLKKVMRRGEYLSDLTILTVNPKKGHFTLQMPCMDGEVIEEVGYKECLERVAGWASVKLPEAVLTAAAERELPVAHPSQTAAADQGAKASSPPAAEGAKERKRRRRRWQRRNNPGAST